MEISRNTRGLTCGVAIKLKMDDFAGIGDFSAVVGISLGLVMAYRVLQALPRRMSPLGTSAQRSPGPKKLLVVFGSGAICHFGV